MGFHTEGDSTTLDLQSYLQRRRRTHVIATETEDDLIDLVPELGHCAASRPALSRSRFLHDCQWTRVTVWEGGSLC